ncbi:MAG: glycosyl hydrolase [Verrucomicrobia bacterium]|nr:glycosyl hydrolase [Verrucomicrobiota bacterium]
MNRTLQSLTIIGVAIAAMPFARSAESSPATLEKQFRELPMDARRLTGPLFWLHGDESKDRLESYLDKVAASGNGSFTAESRPHNDWLGEGWYRDLDICLQAAKKHDLKMWIFDEKWWPSQGVGGKVPPRYAAKRLAAEAADVSGPAPFQAEGYAGERYIATLAGQLNADGKIEGGSLIDLADRIKDGKLSWQAPAGKWKVMKFTHIQAPGLGQSYSGQQLSVDGASRDCTEWFINTVYQPHFDRFGADFGKTIPGFFYDEPETKGDWGTALNTTLKEWNIDWKQAYVAYKFGLAGEDDVAARYQYLDAFAETWGRVMYGGMADWCRNHKVKSMGHFMEHDSLYVNRDYCAGDMMRLQKYSDMGGLDLVCQQLYPGQRRHDIYQTPKLASSITHVYNKEDDLTMCEMFGAYGQNITYPQMKWLTDQMQVRGVNFMIPHSFNPRAPFDGDCPPYFYNGGFEPRYPLYKVYADYTSRLSLMLSGGRHVCPIALLFSGTSKQVGKMVTPEDMTSAIQDALYDCDWLPFEVFEGKAALKGKELALYNERYQVLIVPPVEVIPYATLAKAKAFFDQGGLVIGYGYLPTKSATIGKTAADIVTLSQAIWGAAAKPGTAACNQNAQGGKSYLLSEQPSVAELSQVLAKDAGVPPVLEVVEGDTNNWLHVLHREKSGRDVFLVCNQDPGKGAKDFVLRATAPGEPECWDAMRNEITALPYKRNGSVAEIRLTLEPSESVLLVFQAAKRALPMRGGGTGPHRDLAVRDTRPPAPKDAPPKLVVVTATYGVPGDAQRSRDVRSVLQGLIDAGERTLQVARLAAGGDPAQGTVKTLVAECTSGDKPITLKGQDPETIVLNGRPSAYQQELQRLAAGRSYTASPVLEPNPFAGACTLPADVDLGASRIYLELDTLAPEEAAAITVNGQPAGGFICKPFRLEVTRYLKAGENTLEIAPFTPASAHLAVYPK